MANGSSVCAVKDFKDLAKNCYEIELLIEMEIVKIALTKV